MLEMQVSLTLESAMVEAEEMMERTTDPLELARIAHDPALRGAESLAHKIGVRLGYGNENTQPPPTTWDGNRFRFNFACQPELLYGNGTPKLGRHGYRAPGQKALELKAHQKLKETTNLCLLCSSDA